MSVVAISSPTRLLPTAVPDQPAWYDTTPLQAILPPEFSPVAIRIISEYAAIPTLLGKQVRLQLHGVLLDGFVVGEEVDAVVVLTACGASLRVPRSDLGGLVWRVDPDANPHSLRQLGPRWLSAATDNGGRVPEVDTCEMHSNPRPLGVLGSVHRRIRCFEPHETKMKPFKPPYFLYTKLYFPYLSLLGVDKPCAPYMREVAAHTLLPLCRPVVAPLAHYASLHEEAGSYAIVMEDLSNVTSYFHPTSSDIKVQSGATGDITYTTDPQFEKDAKRLFGSLAMLHGRFVGISDTTLLHGSPHGFVGTSPPTPKADAKLKKAADPLESKVMGELCKAMTHPIAFYAEWLQCLEEAAAESFMPEGQLQRLRGILASIYAQNEEPNVVSNREEEEVDDFSPAGGVTASSLTLIHGSICPGHVLLTSDARAVPNCYLVDWKRSGLGPLEVDLVYAYCQYVSRRTRKEDPDLLIRLLNEYVCCMDVFYSVKRTIPELLCAMRDVAFLMLMGGKCDWNNNGDMETALASVYQQLADRTTNGAIRVLIDKLSNNQIPL